MFLISGNKHKIFLFSLTTFLALFWQPALAMQIIAECGVAKGHVLYKPSALLDGKQEEWKTDKMSRGETLLVRLGENYGIMIRQNNQIQPLYSAEVVPLRIQQDDLLFSVVSANSRSAELYNFYSHEDQHFFVVFQSRADAMIGKNSILAGKCSEIDYSLFRD